MKPELVRLRRFSLVIALILITYAGAGITLREDATISPFGVPFTIERPDLLPLGLAFASVYAAGSFFYWGAMCTASPTMRRRKYRDLARPSAARHGILWLADDVPALTSPTTDEFRSYQLEIKAASPRVGLLEAGSTFLLVGRERDSPMRELQGQYALSSIELPLIVNLLARIEEIDYFAPVWLNVAAVGCWILIPLLVSS